MRIAYLANGIPSQLTMGLELSRRLREAGHEVTYLGHPERESRVRAHGFDFVRLDADRRLQRDAESHAVAWRDARSPRRFARRALERRRIRRRSLANDEIERRIRALAPERLVIDLELHFAVQATRGLGIPTVLAMGFFSVHRQRGLPPLSTPLRPAAAGEKIWRLELAWWRLLLETRHFEWRQRLGKLRRCELFPPVAYDTYDIDDLRALARERRFPLRRECSRREWLRPYMYRRLPVLCLTARELDLPQRTPDNLRYVGPMVPPPDRRRAEDASEPEGDRASGLRAWRRFREARRPQRPLVYCSLGSLWSADEGLLRRVVEVFARRPDWDLVLGLGGKLEPGRLGRLAGNVLALSWAPQLEVLAHSRCAITHGGLGTVHECVRLGVPMIVYSTGFVEQHGNATRVGFHGLGIVVDRNKDGVRDLGNHVAQALEDHNLRDRVEAMRQRLENYERTGLAVTLVETGGAGPAQGGAAS